jgi:hypothetical protein
VIYQDFWPFFKVIFYLSKAKEGKIYLIVVEKMNRNAFKTPKN